MNYLAWDDDLLIGIDEIDVQHQNLFRFVNDMQEQVRAGEGNSQIESAIQKVVAYVHTHFTEEERLMAAHGYPGLAVQQAEHRKYTAQIAAFIKRSKQNQSLLARDILLFLRSWYISHISHTDRAFGEYMKQHETGDGSGDTDTVT